MTFQQKTMSEAFDLESDDRHVQTVAQSRAGKGTSLIIPTLLRWKHSCVVTDPKGENATETAVIRAAQTGQQVVVLDPFCETKGCDAFKARINPLDSIDHRADDAVDQAASLATALVVAANSRDMHWDESARQLIEGLILHVCDTEPAETRTLTRVRQLLIKGDADFLEAKRAHDGDADDETAFDALWEHMGLCECENEAVQDAIVGAAESIQAMGNNERGSVLSTARRNTRFLGTPAMRDVLSSTSFDMDALKTDPNGMTIYLCLPARYLATHARFLRLILSRIFFRMEDIGLAQPASGGPVLFVLDEFPVLGHMEILEKAAGLMAGYGVKLWTICQDLSQLKRHYRESWETFVGNAGILTFFGNTDLTTLEWISKRLGERDVVKETKGTSKSQAKGATQNEGESTQTGSSSSKGQSQSVSDMAALSKTATVQSGQSIWELLTRRAAPTQSQSASNSTNSGKSESRTVSQSQATSETVTQSTSIQQQITRQPVMQPKDIAKRYARETGLMLVVKPGDDPVEVKRVAYFDDPTLDALLNQSKKA